MAVRTKGARKGLQKLAAQVYRKLRAGVGYIWSRPLILSVVLLALAVLLFNELIRQAFKTYMNCNYLIVTQLNMDAFFCKGYDVRAFGSSIFKIPGLSSVMDPPLELVRTGVAWGIVLFFALISFYLTIFLNNLKAVVKLVTFNKEQWKSFLTGLRTWLLIFVVFCSLFYFAVIR